MDVRYFTKSWIMILYLQAFCIQAKTSLSKFKMQENLVNVLIAANNIQELTTSNEVDCARKCLSNQYCAGFAFHNEWKICRLFDDFNFTGTYELGWLVYQKDGPYCSKPAGYTLYSSLPLCLKFYGNQTDYLASVEQCRSDGAVLIRIDNEQTQNIVYTFLKSEMQFQGKVFIQGHRDPGNLNTWLFDDGSLLKYLPWNIGQPESTSQDVLLVNTEAGGLWHDAEITQPFAFLCQIQLDM